MNVLAIVNPLSGARAHPEIAQRRVALLERRFEADRIDGVVRLTERANHAAELALEAVQAGVRTVIAWGGDGTVNEIGSVLVDTDTTLAVIPAGSGNGFAAALDLPRDPAAALEIALSGDERAIDVGEIDGRRFFNIAGVGVDAVIAERFNAQEKGKRGMGPYFRIGVGQAFAYHGEQYRVWLDGHAFDVRALLIAFANGCEYGSGARIAPHARQDDGLLEAVIVEDRPPLSRLWVARHLITRTPQKASGVRFASVVQATIETDRPIVYHVDGEPGRGGTTVAVRVRPRALRVRAPRKGGSR
jgi:YegS/Rv2252/BmrU family lipid kinase